MKRFISAAVLTTLLAALVTALSFSHGNSASVPGLGLIQLSPRSGSNNIPTFSLAMADSNATTGVPRIMQVNMDLICSFPSSSEISLANLPVGDVFPQDAPATLANSVNILSNSAASFGAFSYYYNQTSALVIPQFSNAVGSNQTVFMLGVGNTAFTSVGLELCNKLSWIITAQWQGMGGVPAQFSIASQSPSGLPGFIISDGGYTYALDVAPTLFYQEPVTTGVSFFAPQILATNTSALTTTALTLVSFAQPGTNTMVMEYQVPVDPFTNAASLVKQQAMYVAARLSVNKPAVSSAVTSCTSTVTVATVTMIPIPTA